MPLTKNYYRYDFSGVFNISCSSSCNIVTIAQANKTGRYDNYKKQESARRKRVNECVVFGFAEFACIWDLRNRRAVSRLKAADSELRQIAVDNKNELLALGYADGTVAAYRIDTEELLFASKSHKASVSSLSFAEEGALLASGSLDCQIVFWDLLSRTGICRVKGHTNAITQLKFVQLAPNTPSILISSSLDATLKIWETSSAYRCCATITGHVSSINSFVFVPFPDNLLITASSDAELRVFNIKLRHADDLTAPEDDDDDNRIANFSGERVKKIRTIIPTNHADEDDDYSPVAWDYVGSILRSTHQQQLHDSADQHKTKRRQAINLCLSRSVDESYILAFLNTATQHVEQYKIFGGTQFKKLVRRANRKRTAVAADVENIFSNINNKRAAANNDDADDDTGTAEPLKPSELLELRIRAGGKLNMRTVPNFINHSDTADENDENVAENEFDNDSFHKLALGSKALRIYFTSTDAAAVDTFRQTKTNLSSLVCVYSNLLCFLPVDAKHLQIQPLLETTSTAPAAAKLSTFMLPSHESDVRALAFSHDGELIASGSASSIRIWHVGNLQEPVAAANSPYIVSIAFLHASRYVLVGSKAGELLTFDVQQARFIDRVADAHEGTCWALCMQPAATDNNFVSAGEDKKIKLWQSRLPIKKKSRKNSAAALQEDQQQSVAAGLHEMLHEWDVEDSVTDVKFSPNGKFIAFALLDNTVRIHFADSFKFFLSLYGHSLPVLSIDISFDSKLIITGSADKNVKIWGMDFGDCHRSLFAHDESITCVRFAGPDSHLFFSCARDGRVKQWDADKFVNVLTLPESHLSETWCMAISPQNGDVVTAGHDKAMRLWSPSEELLVLDEEQRLEREQQQQEAEKRPVGDEDDEQEELVLPAERRDQLTVVEPRSLRTMDAVDQVVESIAIYESELQARAVAGGGAVAAQHSVLRALGNISAEQHFLECLRRVRPHSLQTTLLSLPSDCVTKAAKILLSLLMSSSSSGGGAAVSDLDLIVRSLISLMRLNALHLVAAGRQQQAQASGESASSSSFGVADLKIMRDQVQEACSSYRNLIAINSAALRSARHQLRLAEDDENVFADAVDLYVQRKQRKKRHQQQQAAATLTMN